MARIDRVNGIETSVAIKAPCRVATTENISLYGLQTINGVDLAAGDRVLVKNQTKRRQNGIWVAGGSDWTRALDLNGRRDAVKGTQVAVNEGATGRGAVWRLVASDEVVIGTSNLDWEWEVDLRPTTLTTFDSKLEAEQASIGSNVDAVSLAGYSAPGDGGAALYKRAGSEPSHAGKVQSADGAWWELAPTQRITPQMFGATGLGVTEDTAAFNKALAYCRVNRAPLHIPIGTYLLDSLDPVFTDLPSAREQMRIVGAGRDLSVIRYVSDLASPLFDVTPDASGRQAQLELSDLTIDGQGHSGTAIRIANCSKFHLQRLSFRDIADHVIFAEKWWDSHHFDVYIHSCGDAASQKAAVVMQNLAGSSDPNDTCNQMSWYDLHIEESPFRSLDILDGTRALNFFRLKIHQLPGGGAMSDNMLIDGRNHAAGPGYDLNFYGPLLAVCPGGSQVVIDNSGGAAGSGFSSVNFWGGRLAADGEYGLHVKKCMAVSVQGVRFTVGSGAAAGYQVEDGAYGVDIDFDSCIFELSAGKVPGHYNGSTRIVSRISGGALTAVGKWLRVDVEGGFSAGTLAYDSQTSNFTVGQTLTGATSGATAIIDSDSDGGTSGTLTLSAATAEFANGETITDGAGGSATAVGQITSIDVIDSIHGLKFGQSIVISSANAYRRVDIRDAAISGGNIQTSGARTRRLRTPEDIIILRNVGTAIVEESYSSKLRNSVLYNPPTLADGAGATTSVPLPNIQFGDDVGCRFEADLQGVQVTCWIASEGPGGTVGIRFQNETGGSVDLAEASLGVFVRDS